MRRRPDPRRVIVTAVAAAALLTSTGCVTTTSYSCSGSTCTVTLSGEGASTQLGSEGSSITLVAIEDGAATIELNGAQGSCSAGDTIELAESSVECTKVDGDAVELTLTA